MAAGILLCAELSVKSCSHENKVTFVKTRTPVQMPPANMGRDSYGSCDDNFWKT